MAGIYDFTNPEDVKDYWENFRVENLFGCLKQNDPHACERLGQYYESYEKRFQEAANVYKKCCGDFRHPGCCARAGFFHIVGKGKLKKDPKEAFRCYRSGCYQDIYEKDMGVSDKIGKCCYGMGYLMQKHHPIKDELLNMPELERTVNDDLHPQIKDPPTDLAGVFKRSCVLKNNTGCDALADLYRCGSDGYEKNLKLAAKYYQMGCDFGSGYSCHNLSVMYKQGDGVEQNIKKSKEFYQKYREIIHGNASLKMGVTS